MSKRLVVYDCEIKKAILGRGEVALPHIEYCGGWRDFANMGISCITAYDVDAGLPRVFCEDNFHLFRELAHDPEVTLCGFNNRQFDDRLIGTIEVTVPPERSWDLLREIWISNELNPDTFVPATHGGFGLDAVAFANLQEHKSGSGALAPVLWQQGKLGAVVDYCMRDTMLTYRLIQRAIEGRLVCPKTGRILRLSMPDPFFT